MKCVLTDSQNAVGLELLRSLNQPQSSQRGDRLIEGLIESMYGLPPSPERGWVVDDNGTLAPSVPTYLLEIVLRGGDHHFFLLWKEQAPSLNMES